MLFNSYGFIFVFLPTTFLGFFYLGRFDRSLSIAWLSGASLVFYAWWNVLFLPLLIGSIAFNYAAAMLVHAACSRPSRARLLLVIAITGDLTLLGYFKYYNFFATSVVNLTGLDFAVGQVILPIGISFFTFTQIAFLVDTFQDKVRDFNFGRYLLFVTYFPHLIAGPILHHDEMMPQFADAKLCRPNLRNLAVGSAVFVVGLAKKVFIADSLATLATPIFSAVANGGHPMLIEAWLGALAYTFQLYFDFSAYCDMAIGISLIFNVRLPLNFNSPYKSSSMIDFWRRWHMTLSRFLRDYLYVPLGGNRRGQARRYSNLLITMLLGGLWHGAGWTFIVWGMLHGGYLMVNHAWRALTARSGWPSGGILGAAVGGLLTFVAVVVGWVFFRADRLATAVSMLRGMAGVNGISFPKSVQPWLEAHAGANPMFAFFGTHPLAPALDNMDIVLWIGVAATLIWFFPNAQQIFGRFHIALDKTRSAELSTAPTPQALVALTWRPNRRFAWLMGVLFAFGVMELTRVSEFLYFQF